MKRAVVLLSASAVISACSGSSSPDVEAGLPDAGTAPDATMAAASSPQLPPRGQQAVEAWLAGNFYKSWHCEPSPVSGRPGAHDVDRICSNDALSAATGAPFPVGSASVLEMYDDQNRFNGFAVGVKVAAGAADSTWYWYERGGASPTSRPVSDGVGNPTCGSNCHALADTDNVFVRVR